jgi:hypothetical protein
LSPPARGLHPLAKMREQGGRVFFEAVGEEQRHTPCGQDLHRLCRKFCSGGREGVVAPYLFKKMRCS